MDVIMVVLIQGTKRYNILVLYKNGIVFLPGQTELKDMGNYIMSILNDAKYEWGAFRIDDITLYTLCIGNQPNMVILFI